MPTMSPEQALLLQVLRRAKRQQDLVIEVQKDHHLYLSPCDAHQQKTEKSQYEISEYSKSYTNSFQPLTI